ncbi:MAG: hypothetical protein AB7O38_25045, partial [Pirellulaceae bacterium]
MARQRPDASPIPRDSQAGNMMSHCPHCSRTISASDEAQRVCPHCGQPLDRHASPGSETVVEIVPDVTPSEGDDAMRPVDLVASPLPPPDEARMTLPAGASAQTVGSGEFLDVEAAERFSRATDEVRRGRSTIASDHDDTATGADPSKTVVAGRGLPTVEQDFIELPDEPLTDPPADTGRIAQTLDSIDFPQDVPVLDDPRRTVDASRLAQTLDSDSVGESGVPLPWLTGDGNPIARTV